MGRGRGRRRREQRSPAAHLPPAPRRSDITWPEEGGGSSSDAASRCFGPLPVGGFLSVTAGNKGQVWGHIGESNC